jgi:hypothetical protein
MHLKRVVGTLSLPPPLSLHPSHQLNNFALPHSPNHDVLLHHWFKSNKTYWLWTGTSKTVNQDKAFSLCKLIILGTCYSDGKLTNTTPYKHWVTEDRSWYLLNELAYLFCSLLWGTCSLLGTGVRHEAPHMCVLKSSRSIFTSSDLGSDQGPHA